MEIFVYIPTQRYDAPSGKVMKIFVEILSVELEVVFYRKWNAERVIVFQSGILQHAQSVNNYVQIRKRIFFRLKLWNRGAFDRLVKDTYNSEMGYLRKARGNQTMEESHQTFSNLVLKEKLCKTIHFVCEREKGGVFNQKNWMRIVRALSTRPSHRFWRGEILAK